MSSMVARAILPHLQSGPVLDLLFTAKGYLPQDLLSAPPSDAVVLKAVKSMGANEVINLVAVVESPQVLDAILAKEKRVTVLRAIARNPHLSAEALTELAARASSRRDQLLFEAFLETRQAPARFELLLDWYRRSFVVSKNALKLYSAIFDLDSDARPGAIKALLDVALVRAQEQGRTRSSVVSTILSSLLGRYRKVEPSAAELEGLLEYAKELAAPDKQLQEAMFLLFWEHPSYLVRAASLGWSNLSARILASPAGLDLGLDVSAIINGCDQADITLLGAAWVKQGRTVDLHLAERAVKLTGGNALVYHYMGLPRCTSEAALFLATRSSSQRRFELLHQVEDSDAAARVLVGATGNDLRHVSLEASVVERVLTLDVPLDVKLRLVGKVTGTNAMTAPVRLFVCQSGALDMVRRIIASSDSEVEALLARGEGFAAHATRVLSNENTLSDEVRRRCLDVVEPAQLAVGAAMNGLRSGELTYVLERPDAQLFLDELKGRLNRTQIVKAGPWASEAVRLVPLVWPLLPEVLIAEGTRQLVEAFGTDMEAWSVALTLLHGWEGTITELIGVSQGI